MDVSTQVSKVARKLPTIKVMPTIMLMATLKAAMAKALLASFWPIVRTL